MKSRHLLFSIIIPTFNRAHLLGTCIEHVIVQKYPDWELIVVDDGSTDDTASVAKQFKDERIHYHPRPHQGRIAARNFGMDNARGDIITYVDSDDFIYPHYLSEAEKYFADPETIFALSNYRKRKELYKDGMLVSTVHDPVQNKPLSLQDIIHWKVKASGGTGMFHRQATRDHGIRWDESLNVLEDWDLIMQMGNLFPNGFRYILEPLFDYVQRYGSDGICGNLSYADWANGFEAIYKKHAHEPLLNGQEWYPQQVEKYRKLQEEYEQGKTSSPVIRYFRLRKV